VDPFSAVVSGGTGACLAVPVVEVSARILREMATFDSAGLTDKDR
jgi:nicotinate-nucleotide--dimethylbenzimidazole phosphoribosyltransferase